MSSVPSDNERLVRICRDALGSLHCELSRREKCVLDQIVTHSFGLDQDFAWFGSSDQLALLAELHKTDTSAALSNLRRMRIIHAERAAPVPHFRRPMVYRVLVAELVRVSSLPVVGENRGVQKAKAATAAYLIHANRCYPLQPDLLPPDPNEFELAMAEISRASALAQYPAQNAAPKPGVSIAGEVRSAEDEEPPGRTLYFPDAPEISHETVSSDEARLRVRESFEKANSPVSKPALPVGDFQTTSPPSLKFSNYSCARDQISDDSDGDRISPSGNQIGDARGPVGEIQTTPRLGIVLDASLVLSRYGEEWKPPTAAGGNVRRAARGHGRGTGELRELVVEPMHRSWHPARCARSTGDVEAGEAFAQAQTVARWSLAR